MTTHKNPNEYERLKQELRRLKRASAPWYFESELHQRLHGTQTRRTRLRPLGPAPAFLISFLALGSLAVAAYILLVNTDLFTRGSSPLQTAPSEVSSAAHVPAVDSSAFHIGRPAGAPPRRTGAAGPGVSDTAHAVSAPPASRLPVLPSTAAPTPEPDSTRSRAPLPAADTGEVGRRNDVTPPGRDTLPIRRDTAVAPQPGTPGR